VPVKTVKGLPTVTSRATPIKLLPTAKPYQATPVPIPQSAYNARLHGTVTDAKSHSPLAGAVVTVSVGAKHQTTTSALGKYSLTFPGGYAAPVTITMRGYFQFLAEGRVAPHKSYRLDVQLQRRTPGGAPSPPSVFGKP
jgi:hypothetical protein